MSNNIEKQRGAAAIFIVVFFAILISIISLSFLRIAVQDQQQASSNDLSQSAFDSANAGLEDSKRALSWYNAHCPLNTAPALADQTNCTAYITAFTKPNPRCNIADIIHNTNTLPYTNTTTPTGTEVAVTSTAADSKLDQAYTCTTITTQTKDFRGDANNGKSDTLIPLRTVGNLPIDTVELNWSTNRNPTPLTPTYPNPVTKELPNSAWSPNTPPIMRFELIPALRGNININDVNGDAKTVFLYPAISGSSTIGLAAADLGRTTTPSLLAAEKTTAPNLARCQASIPSGEFACSVRVNLSGVFATGGNAGNTDYFLRLTAIYNNADYQIRLLDAGGTTLRLFNNVEPQIDATGRANDIFRRIQSRVRNITNSNPLTDGGFDITQGLCKNFNVPVYSSPCPSTLINP